MRTHDQLTVSHQAAWRELLTDHEDTCDGIWVALAEKDTGTPTSLTYAQALEDALRGG
jgi:hypothetical protein